MGEEQQTWQTQPSQTELENPPSESNLEKSEAKLLNRCKEANKVESEAPNYQTCMLENPLRVKYLREEICVCSLHKLRTSTLKYLQYMVFGSTHPLEQLCSYEIDDILQRRKGEDPKLDKQRRKTLNTFPGRRFKLIEGNLKFRSIIYGQEKWMDFQDAKVCLSKSIQRYIEEVEDDAISPIEISMVEGLRSCLAEALIKEDEARQKRKSQAK